MREADGQPKAISKVWCRAASRLVRRCRAGAPEWLQVPVPGCRAPLIRTHFRKGRKTFAALGGAMKVVALLFLLMDLDAPRACNLDFFRRQRAA